jgi:hypothetical protein
MKYYWGVKWRSDNKLDGKQEYLLSYDCLPLLFLTRDDAREYIWEKYNYIKTRKDLQEEPHGWKMPIPVKVKVVEV